MDEYNVEKIRKAYGVSPVSKNVDALSAPPAVNDPYSSAAASGQYSILRNPIKLGSQKTVRAPKRIKSLKQAKKEAKFNEEFAKRYVVQGGQVYSKTYIKNQSIAGKLRSFFKK